MVRLLLLLVIEIHQHVAVRAIASQQDQDNEVRDEQRHVKGVGMVESAKRGVEKMITDVVPDALGSVRRRQLRTQDEIRNQQSAPMKTSILPDWSSPGVRGFRLTVQSLPAGPED